MASEGHIFRDAYKRLDEMAPAAPRFEALGMLTLSAVPSGPRRARWATAAALSVAILAVVAIPSVIWLAPNSGGLGQGLGTTTSTVAAVATTHCPPTTAPGVATSSPEGTTTSTISVTGETAPTCSETTVPSPTTTSTIGPPTSTMPESDPSRVFTIAEAEAFLEEFLGYMRQGDFVRAEQLYAADYNSLIEWNPGVDPTDRVGLLEAGCHQLLCQLQIREVVSSDLIGSVYTFVVMLEYPDGTLVSFEDQDGGTQTEWQFAVVNENGVLKSLSLPLYLP